LEKKRTFLYEYLGEGKYFTIAEFDDVMMSRLAKNRDENKFIYIIQSYRRLENHLYTKGTALAQAVVPEDKIIELKQ
jgi:hypothetical protein